MTKLKSMFLLLRDRKNGRFAAAGCPVHFHAGSRLLFGMIIGLAILCAGWWKENHYGSILTVKNVLPASLAVVWLGFWPALQQWGSVGLFFPGEEQDVEWWANGFTRWVVLLIITLGGYSYVYRTRDGY
ncbi:hypothetical protein [Pseudomonas amygdali]|uniref:hypothetical protein n=2 Tax=Pseudomonas amygdali TaxID=47877 RepID=UPI001F347F9C|nr:hypothetical protein [Pseudomonas amygdali]